MKRCMGCMAELAEEAEVCPDCGYVQSADVKEAYYLFPGTRLKEKYIVGKVVGYGGFGVTYIGWDTQLNRKVAVKEYLPSDFATRSYGSEKLTVFSGDATVQFDTGLDSFIAEAKRLAKLNECAQIVKVYDCFIENDTGYIIMEYLEGESVKDLLKRDGKLSYEKARDIMIAVLTGLGRGHQEGLIHRDIAPDNIMLHPDGSVKIIDFGAARYATIGRSKSLSVILKPGYAPEEQYRSHGNQGPWTDIYAAGATFYRMVTGQRPPESIERLREDTLKSPSELGISLPQDVENALMNSLNLKAENRIQDAETFCRVLKEQERMERFREERKREEDAKAPLWVKLAGGVAVCLVLLLVVLAASGRLRFSQTEIRAESDRQVLAENQSFVPDISGVSYEEAEEMLQGTELKLVINGMNYSETIEKDRILSQEPASGAAMEKGEKISVVMSGGNQEIMMMDLSGMQTEEAASLIQAQGLIFAEEDIAEEYSDVVQKGRIISQSIAAGERVPVKSNISFVVSKGKLNEETAVLKVPDLTGLTKKKALAALEQLKEEAGFTYTLGKITRENSTEVKKNRIISQSLAPGSEARTNQVIALVISDGPKMVQMPNVVFLSENDAHERLSKLGLKVQMLTDYSSKVEKGCVISQSAEADTELAMGSEISLTVSLGEKPSDSDQKSGGKSDQGSSGRDSSNQNSSNSGSSNQGTPGRNETAQPPAQQEQPPAPQEPAYEEPPAPQEPANEIQIAPDDDIQVAPDDVKVTPGE